MRSLKTLVCLAIFTAAAIAAEVAGTWQMTIETPNGQFEATVDLKQDGEKLTGTLHNQFGDSEISGTLKDNEIALSQKMERDGQSISITFSGKIDGEKMTGKFKFGDFGEGDWSAKKK